MTWFRRPASAPALPPSSDPAEAAWPFVPDSPAVAETLQHGGAVKVMLVDLTGLDWDTIEPLLATAREVARAQGMVPVLAVDTTDMTDLRKAAMAYDTLPNAAANAPLAQGLDWAAYVARCRRLLADKWQPAAVVHLGTHADW